MGYWPRRDGNRCQAANYSAVDEAKAIIRARRAARAAGEDVL